ncbi:Pyruvate ferredoxin/flavodoxin oxidoreductase [Neomoorella glycerini]|uniref:Pyruvate ferredoxin/flavodoxin oxidoreductase n=1 Tax=Neomoorella glycerini TaxID=55779 RepID=A0A6I5ZNN1_9FIRM|nr:indolepyruvate oxidoreductase subunit beta [Moorella glycerini]QGP91530.1 Pyruvate ferredoxin/flavodoxin oxidoreductase [Moorella glycerini]
MSNGVINVLLVGVGGQGTILAGRVLSLAALSLGGEVKVSDIHGMAQRGGSVVTQVRFGPRVYAPVMAPGTADFLVAFEKLEARRWLPYLKLDGWLIVNDQEMPPLPVLTGAGTYPEDLVGEMGRLVNNMLALDALELARRAGNVKSANMVLMGALARRLPISREAWEEALAVSVPGRFLEVNRKAFYLGWDQNG